MSATQLQPQVLSSFRSHLNIFQKCQGLKHFERLNRFVQMFCLRQKMYMQRDTENEVFFICMPAVRSTSARGKKNLAGFDFQTHATEQQHMQKQDKQNHSRSPGGRSQGEHCRWDDGSTHDVLTGWEQGQGNNQPWRWGKRKSKLKVAKNTACAAK